MTMNKKKAEIFYQTYVDAIYHQRQVDRLGEFYTQDVKVHVGLPDLEPGLAGLTMVVNGWLAALSDLRVTTDEFTYDDGFIAPRVTIEGIHSGPFLGFPASGLKLHFIDHPHYRLEDGKIAEFWDFPDIMSIMQQLGAVTIKASRGPFLKAG